MMCPHCQNDTEKPATLPYIIMKPTRVKNLYITSWCTLCKKAKSWSGNLVMGGSVEDDADTQPAPETCYCDLFKPAPIMPYPWLCNNNAAIVSDGTSITIKP